MRLATFEQIQRALEQKKLLEDKNKMFDFAFAIFGSSAHKIIYDFYSDSFVVKDKQENILNPDFSLPFWNNSQGIMLQDLITNHSHENIQLCIFTIIEGRIPRITANKVILRLNELPFEDEEIKLFLQ